MYELADCNQEFIVYYFLKAAYRHRCFEEKYEKLRKAMQCAESLYKLINNKQYIIINHKFNMSSTTAKKAPTHKARLAHKLAKYVRANPVHLKPADATRPSITHITYGGAPRAGVTNRAKTWYPADDESTHFKRRRLAPRPAHLRASITPGKILILLAGKYRGKRVVFLRQLPSGLLLVTGPHNVNGVPLRRVNSAYVLATSSTVDLAGVNTQAISDNYFRKVVAKGKRSEGSFKHGKRQLSEDQVQQEAARSAQNKATQRTIDVALLANIKKTPFLRKYLSSRFTLYNNTRPHELVF